MARLILFNKPHDVLSRFTDPHGRSNLADFIRIPGVYPAGRLDRDSEGLLLLTDDGALQHRLSHPRSGTGKTYLVQVEGEPPQSALEHLRHGIALNDGPCRPATVERIPAPKLWPRNPPVRSRRRVPDCWLQLTISEGRNRQVRRMTAAVGHPTLRLVRWRIGDWDLADLAPGQWRETSVHLPRRRHRRPGRH